MPRISILRGAPRALKEAAARIHKIRDEIPVRQYLELINSAALTGKLSKFHHTPDGRLVPSGRFDDLDADQRIDLMRYLTNKALPDARDPDPVTLALTDSDDASDAGRIAITVAAERISALPIEDLRRLAGSASANPFDPPVVLSQPEPVESHPRLG